MLKNKKLMALLLGGIIGTSSILAGCGSGGMLHLVGEKEKNQ